MRAQLRLFIGMFMLLALTGCESSTLTGVADAPAIADESASASKNGDTVGVCHRNDDGALQLIQINHNALNGHRGHGDVLPGESVPNVFAKEYGADCSIVDSSPDFVTFYIRNNNNIPLAQRISAPWDTDMILVENPNGDGYTFSTPQAGQKVGYGTSFFDGLPLNRIETVNWTKVSGMNGGIVTYLNFWVTDGTNYAVIASENQYQGTQFSARQEWKIFEFNSSAGFSWLFADGSVGGRDGAQYLTRNGVRATLSQLGDNIVIRDPGIPYPSYVGTGAPRGGYGLNLIWGDTQANFAQKSGQIADLSVRVFGTTYYAEN